MMCIVSGSPGIIWDKKELKNKQLATARIFGTNVHVPYEGRIQRCG